MHFFKAKFSNIKDIGQAISLMQGHKPVVWSLSRTNATIRHICRFRLTRCADLRMCSNENN